MTDSPLFLDYEFETSAWWRAYLRLAAALLPDADPQESLAAYGELLGALVAGGHRDLASAIAAGLAGAAAPFDAVSAHRTGTAAGALALLRRDLATLAGACRRDLTGEVRSLGLEVPAAADLALPLPPGPQSSAVAAMSALLLGGADEARLAEYVAHLANVGSGASALHGALRWDAGRLVPIAKPFAARLEELHGLEQQIGRLTANTEALLAAAPAHDALLYGPRGSGKSTAVRALLTRYQDAGLRIVELPLEALDGLPALLEAVSELPQRFVVFVDDLAFEDGDRRYGPLKRVLDGGLIQRPANAVVYATSNRRHLVTQRHRDRPDPLDDDVHAWDTHNERLALADRFGLVLTFPGAGQKRYLELVKALAAQRGIAVDDRLEDAVRFAEWGNGYSGRTARQFIDTLAR